MIKKQWRNGNAEARHPSPKAMLATQYYRSSRRVKPDVVADITKKQGIMGNIQTQRSRGAMRKTKQGENAPRAKPADLICNNSANTHTHRFRIILEGGGY